MTPYETLVHNLTAVALKITDPEKVRRVISRLKPGDGLVDTIQQVTDGPFGSVELACDCEAIEGYAQAVADIIVTIQAKSLPAFKTQEARNAVVMDREGLVAGLYAVLREAAGRDDVVVNDTQLQRR